MKSKSKSFEDLDTIRTIMERSTRFMSLSGLSGVYAGLIAIAGSAVAFLVLFKGNFKKEYLTGLRGDELGYVQKGLALDALAVLVLAIVVALIFSYRRTVQLGQRMWTPVSQRLLISMLVPLGAGGIFILILFSQEFYGLIIPSMLIFYGLALVNAGKFTYNEVFYLGLSEVVIGLVAALLPESGLLFWTLGFGVLHIVYGFTLYRKYEK
jgi:hypothetical protein